MNDDTHVMIDIETLGTDNDAVILSIGAVEFTVADGIDEGFEKYIDAQSCIDAGLSVDADTIGWWMDQDDAAKVALEGGIHLSDGLMEFKYWMEDVDPDYVWGNSPAFDCVIIDNACDAVGLDSPWKFYQRRDFRTLTDLPFAPDLDHEGVEHDALDDAIHQARVVRETLQNIPTGTP